MSVKSGKFITLEGGEGVGKSTNLSFVHNYLTNNRIPVLTTREPGGTEIAEKLRTILIEKNDEKLTDQAELLLVFAARAQHVEHVIKPALARGEWVLCDRFTDATFAYQGGGRGLPVSAIAWLETFVQQELRPDLTLLLDASSEIGMGRAKARNEHLDRFESERMAFFDQVRKSYLTRAALYPDRIAVINAESALEEVQNQIGQALANLIAKPQ
jgi:dTMP kinase